MSVRNKEELISSLKAIIGENTDDASIGILEDLDDTITDYDTRITESGDWKAKYEENDATWRKKYKDRFDGKSTESDQELDESELGSNVPRTFEELFKEE